MEKESILTLKEITSSRTPVHTRGIQLNTYSVDEKRVVVEGILKDARHIPIYDFDGSLREEGPYHHITARLLMGEMPPLIMDAEAEFNHCPHPLCHELEEIIKNIIGLRIQVGFAGQVHKLVGGRDGCAHLAHLIAVMSHAALHGLWTSTMRDPRPMPSSIEQIEGLDYLIDSCKLWKYNEGPLFKRVAIKLKKD
jgi:hypothetical protein